MKVEKNSYISGFLLILFAHVLFAQESSWARFDQKGNLVYKTDTKGNRIPDFSYVGYRNGELPIPNVDVKKVLSATEGDNLINIQSAIDEVSALKPDKRGIRGAILLKAGTYPVSGPIMIRANGILLIGAGSDPLGTTIIATRREKHNLIHFIGKDGAIAEPATTKKVMNDYVPVGAVSFQIDPEHSFVKGDRVFFQRKPNQQWIELLGMHDLSSTDPNDTDWTPQSYTINYKRKVVWVQGNVITLDAPVVDPVDPQYAEAFIIKYNWDERLEDVGVENIRLISEYAHKDDEDHGWNAIRFDNTENGWVRNISAYHFGYSAVDIASGSSNISVIDSRCIDPISQTTGGRKYSFNVNGQRNLVMNCYTRGGRHDYVTGGRVAGPNVFAYSISEEQKSNIGPHHRWATGLLFDNVRGNGEMDVENRRNSGSGHGWAGAQTLFWNCTAKSIIVQDPPGDHMNWAIGCRANVTGKGHWLLLPIGIVESTGIPVVPESLYKVQLAERLGHKKKSPTKPGRLSGQTVSGHQINLSWKKTKNESAYIIQISADDGNTWQNAAIVSQNVTGCSIEGLEENKRYTFRIAARNAFGYSAFSGPVNVKTW
jgi:hypothetical protein